MTDLEQVAITAAPTGANHRAVSNRANRGPGSGRVVRPFVLLPDAEDWMKATAKGAGDSPKLERRTEESGAQRLAVGVEEVAADAVARVANRLQLRTRQRECRGENLPDPHRAIR